VFKINKIEEKRQAKIDEVLNFLYKIKSGEISQSELEVMQEEWALQKKIGRYMSSSRGLITRAISGYEDDSESAELIGCTYVYYMAHLSRQFVKGMSFENKCDWEVDHIIPISSAKTIEEIQVLSKFTNLRPLWRKDNRKKHSKKLFLI
jgi:hypothetical protein